MKQSGIKVWLLTGDKVEAAKVVGLSTGILEPDMEPNESFH